MVRQSITPSVITAVEKLEFDGAKPKAIQRIMGRFVDDAPLNRFIRNHHVDVLADTKRANKIGKDIDAKRQTEIMHTLRTLPTSK